MSGLNRLLRPRTIAVIGGGAWCANVIEQCQKIRFGGEILPVHPERGELSGVPAYRDIDSLPLAPDAAFIGVNRDATILAVKALAARGAGGAVCFASGFREAQAETGDGADKQEALLAAAGGMAILGPNCYGLLNYLDGVALWPDQHGGQRVESGVAIVTQSSNIAINLTMQARGLPLAYMVTAGNQMQTGLSTIARELLRDERVTALGLHIEGIGDLCDFEAMAEEASRLGKPIVALKVGKSVQARAGAVSHTASLAGSDAGARALLRRLGIGQVSSLAAMLEALKLLHVAGPLSSNRIASMSCSGGEAGLMADQAHDSGLVFPPLNARQEAGLRAALGGRVALANPLDYHTYIWGDEDALTDTFTAMMEADLAIGCVVLDFPRPDRCGAADWDKVIGAVARTKAATGRPMAILGSLVETMPEDVALRLVAMGIVPFAGLPEAIEAMGVAAKLGEARLAQEPLLLPTQEISSHTLTGAEARAELIPYGLRMPASARADSPAAAADLAAELGFPVVLKGEGIAHKTEAKAVALNLASKAEVEAAARKMPAQDFSVEEMILGAQAELLVGVVRDPAHGYVLTLAAGGTLTELLEDSACLLVPAPREDVAKALRSLKLARLLYGYRGAPAADFEAILDTVMAVQAYVAAARPLEVEINPLMCGPGMAIAADALIRIGENHV